MDPYDINDERSLTAWLSDKPSEWAQTVALRAALRVLPYIGFSSEFWLRNFALLTFSATLASWTQLNDKPTFFRNQESGANARFGGVSFNFEEYRSNPIAALAADASYHSADAQSQSLWVASDCVTAVVKADEAFNSVIEKRKDMGEGLDADLTADRLWFGVQSDCLWLSDGPESAKAEYLTGQGLWSSIEPDWFTDWHRLERQLRAIDPNYSSWIEWYERRIRGEQAAFDIPGDKRRVEDKKILRRLAEATDEDFWGKGHEYVNATLKGWLDEARARAAQNIQPLSELEKLLVEPSPTVAETLLQQASPQAQITDGKLDAAPNTTFDKPQYSDNLAELPSELLAYTKTILNSLPTNCAAIVRNCFTGFHDEMMVRGNRPILNIIKAMAASLTAELYGNPPTDVSPDEWVLRDPREWGEGFHSMFGHFFKGYHDLIHHFPLDTEREEFIAATPIDEMAASGEALTGPVDAVAALIFELGNQGFATDNIVRIIEAHQIYNRDIAQLPSPGSDSDIVTPKRRHVLATAGFYLNTYSVLGTTASLYALQTVPAIQALIPKLKVAADALLAFIR